MNEAYKTADEVIKDLLECGRDYSSGREEIARLFNEDLWNGNWDSTTDFDNVLPDLRFIQENEYDQSMDEDEKPDWDDLITFAGGHYIFLA